MSSRRSKSWIAGSRKGLQVLIRVQVKDGQPIREEYVTHRWVAPKN